MSKKRGQRKKKPKPPRPLACPRCHTPADGSTGALLAALAAVLNACSDARLKPRPDHGYIETTQGYVLPLKGGRWTARNLLYDPLHPAPDASGDPGELT